jgi:hypothetical protein
MAQIISLSEVLTLPPVAERQFDIYFVTDLRISDISPTTGDLAFTLTPMNSHTGDMLPEQALGVQVPLWGAIGQVATAGPALDAVLTALADIKAHFRP